MQLPKALSPLRYRSYQWLLSSLTLSIAAEGLWIVAIVWQVVEMGGGPGALSLVTTAGAAGMVAATLIGGVLADRISQTRILFTIEATRGIAIAVVALLAAGGVLELWQLALVAFISGIAQGVYYPAYSALLPSIVEQRDLLAANGLENMLRPAFMQAIGPAIAGLIVAASAPSVALGLTAAVLFAAAACIIPIPTVAIRRELAEASHSAKAMFSDLREGFIYMVHTPWLLATLLFASLMTLVVMGPMEVLTPFLIKDELGGGPRQHAMVLAAFGIGGALASIAIASVKLPRRYLTVMNLMWGCACVPLVAYGFMTEIWQLIIAAFVIGALFNAPMVIWGTLLQRRVPPALLGRVSSLDFFVSIGFMPVSMALAGPVSIAIGLREAFIIAGLVPVVLCVVAIFAARLPRDEIAHPLRDDDVVDVTDDFTKRSQSPVSR